MTKTSTTENCEITLEIAIIVSICNINLDFWQFRDLHLYKRYIDDIFTIIQVEVGKETSRETKIEKGFDGVFPGVVS